MKKKHNIHTFKILVLLCVAIVGILPTKGKAQGNMLNPVEIMSSLVFSVQRLENGNSLFTVSYSVCDVEIVEIDKFGQTVWSYEDDLEWTHSANWCEDTQTILIADTNNNRVIEINRNKEIVWEYDNDINYPNDADRLENGNTLITVRDSDKIIEVTPDKEVVWEYTGVKGPHNADRLANGNTIIANSMDNKIVEVDKDGKIVWEYAGELFWPRDADRLANGNTLIADSRHKRVIEVNPKGEVVWEVSGLPSVYDVDRLANGNTLISVDLNPGQVIEVDPQKRIVWRWLTSDLNKRNGFQYQPSNRTSYLRERINTLLNVVEDMNITKQEYDNIRKLLNLSRKALFKRQYDLNKKLVFDLVFKLEEIISKYQKCEKGTISGVVFDRSTNEPVVNAKVLLFGTIFQTETDSSGQFTLHSIPRLNAGYTMIISKPGFIELQKGNVFPELSFAEEKYEVYLLDLKNEENSYRDAVLSFKISFLREHLQKDDFGIGSRKLTIPEKYPTEINQYLKLNETDSSETQYFKILTDQVNEVYKNSDEKYAELLVLSALQTLHRSMQNNVPVFKLFDEVARSDWQRENGCFGKDYNSAFKASAGKIEYMDSHRIVLDCIKLLRNLNIPARLAWVKSHPVVQWWAQISINEGRWLNTDIINLFSKQKDPDSWMPSMLHNVPSDKITLICTQHDYQTYLDWSFTPEGLWVKDSENNAYFMHNEKGLADAKYSLKNFKERGFPAGTLENLSVGDSVSTLSLTKQSYEVYSQSVLLSIANMKDKKPIKFYVQIPADNEYTKVLDASFFCSHQDWVKSVETETKTDSKTGDKIKIKCITIEPK